MPADPKVGQKFRAEDVPDITTEDDEVLSVSETVTVPAGTFKNCLKIQETLSDGTIEYKYYAPNVGVIKEVTADGEINLVSFGEPERQRTRRLTLLSGPSKVGPAQLLNAFLLSTGSFGCRGR